MGLTTTVINLICKCKLASLADEKNSENIKMVKNLIIGQNYI